jgi:hypothetical protein
LLVVACSYFTLLLATLVSCAYLRVSPSPKLWVGCLLLVSSSRVGYVKKRVVEHLAGFEVSVQPTTKTFNSVKGGF